uniref:Uncharacterized protein n=1 Tax=Macrostomum lignano TaxID=282301 RepID=A0A1I8FH44_9PLAT
MHRLACSEQSLQPRPLRLMQSHPNAGPSLQMPEVASNLSLCSSASSLAGEDEHALIASYAGTLRLRQGSPSVPQQHSRWTDPIRRVRLLLNAAQVGVDSSSAMPIGASPLPMALPPPQTPQPGASCPTEATRVGRRVRRLRSGRARNPAAAGSQRPAGGSHGRAGGAQQATGRKLTRLRHLLSQGAAASPSMSPHISLCRCLITISLIIHQQQQQQSQRLHQRSMGAISAVSTSLRRPAAAAAALAASTAGGSPRFPQRQQRGGSFGGFDSGCFLGVSVSSRHWRFGALPWPEVATFESQQRRHRAGSGAACRLVPDVGGPSSISSLFAMAGQVSNAMGQLVT